VDFNTAIGIEKQMRIEAASAANHYSRESDAPNKNFRTFPPASLKLLPWIKAEVKEKNGIIHAVLGLALRRQKIGFGAETRPLAIDALNKLMNYSVSDRGGLSMDPEE
jgi:hypothetical protein